MINPVSTARSGSSIVCQQSRRDVRTASGRGARAFAASGAGVGVTVG